ncbi:restriction endonuclease subunit S [Corallococcus sp. M34]|uniref:restriction endonuclease subunit S n=1 Tax=Citreicoccus inhibens TaxID=2849499 RepID=UPI001C23E2DC|nr:restriction endonuclease subunit S [Citreicoccus inhibens]MBU8900840.1 restriction endonuclease subunit S [Citreicoccus inhibens]
MSTFDLPQGWAETTLGALGRWSSGGTPSRGNSAFYGGKIPWVKTGELQDGVIKATEENITEEALGASAAKVFPERTLLVAMYGATIGKVGILGTRAATNQACAALVAEGLTTDLIPFVFYYLRSRRDDLRAAGQGGAQPNISQALLKEFPCRLPPLNEQRRIVAKLEALLARSLRAKEALDAIPALLERFRQSVLAAAFRGDLTKDWRAANPDVEPASKLLERIRSERRRRWELAELERMRAKGKVPRDDGWKERYEAAVPATETTGLLPAGWAWATVDELGEETVYGTSAKTNDDSGGVPVLRMGNLQDGKLDLAELKYLPKDHSEFPGLLLKPGDVLFNRTNSPELVGKTAVYCGEPRLASFASYLLRVRVIHHSPLLLSHFINGPAGREWVASVVSQQVGQANVNGTKLRALVVPVPPRDEQRAILSRIDEALARANRVMDVAREQARRLQSLDRALLAKAFQGELVPQDPTDEPASVLLQRIRAKRDKPADDEPGPRTKRRRETKVA